MWSFELTKYCSQDRAASVSRTLVKNASYFLRLGCFRHFPSTVPQMHLWTRDRHLCDGLSQRHRWTCARHGIVLDESKLIIVVQLQLCAVARQAAKFPVQHAQR